MKRRAFMMKTLAVGMGALSITPMKAYSQLAVGDFVNLPTHVMDMVSDYITQAESVLQTVEQIMMVETLIKNTIAPVVQMWDRVNGIVNRVKSLSDRIKLNIRKMGDLEGYLAKFTDLNYYRSSSCYAVGKTCTEGDLRDLRERMVEYSERVKDSLKDLTRTMVDQQDSLVKEAEQLEKLQDAASNDSGQMEALVRANMLTANVAQQLLQMRATQLAMLDLTIARTNAANDQEAKETAIAEKLHQIPKSIPPAKKWKLF